MLIEAGTAAALAGAAVVGYGARGRSSQIFGPSVWRGPRDQRVAALTFDDGPSPATLEVLEILNLFGVRATFFQCGANIDRLPHITRRVAEAGHELGNHTYHHPRLLGCGAGRIRREIADTQRALCEAAGVEARLFRAPYGLRWFGLREALAQHRLTGVMWTVLGYDWEWEAGEIARHVETQTSPGAIICLHDGDRTSPQVDRRRTVRALRTVIPRLYDRGYRLLPAGEMVDRVN
jgi:peptidoglycan/xylan/chitin deacetylase (PgdA/CDA1 family)